MNRIWEIDFLRGTALLLMIFYHLCFDLVEFYGYSIDYKGGLIYFIGKLASTLFIILAGISSSFSKNNRKRSLKILFYALIITLATYVFDSSTYIRFGILHLLGISVFLSPFFMKLSNYLLLGISFLIILIGTYFKTLSPASDLFLVLGLTSRSFSSLDYFPLFPYFGIFLIGVFLGKVLYKEKKTLFRVSFNFKTISKLGQHSLLIYLIHQPFILVLLYLSHTVFK